MTDKERFEQLSKTVDEHLIPALDKLYETVGTLSTALSNLGRNLLDLNFTAEEIMDMIKEYNDDGE